MLAPSPEEVIVDNIFQTTDIRAKSRSLESLKDSIKRQDSLSKEVRLSIFATVLSKNW